MAISFFILIGTLGLSAHANSDKIIPFSSRRSCSSLMNGSGAAPNESGKVLVLPQKSLAKVLADSLAPGIAGATESSRADNSGTFATFMKRKTQRILSSTTLSRLFASGPGRESNRTYSARARDVNFGLAEALAIGDDNPTFVSSGFAKPLLLRDPKYIGWRVLREGKRRIGELVILDEMSPESFIDEVIGIEPSADNLYNYKDEMIFRKSADGKAVQLESIDPSPGESAEVQARRKIVESFPRITYIDQLLSSPTQSPALTSYYGRTDVICDYGGRSLQENDFASVLAQYNSLLKMGGHLFLAIPYEGLTSEGNFEVTTFASRTPRRRVSISGDNFFDLVPGFRLRNAYTVQSGLFEGSVESLA